MNENYHIRDPIHGEIIISPDFLEIIKSREFQRLQYVKQMGLVYVAFPGARHSRYEHSLGTMQLTSSIIDNLKEIIIETNREKEEDHWEVKELKLDKDRKTLLKLAALLHDIGHPPFSHLLEEAIQKSELLRRLGIQPKDFSHETISGNLIIEENNSNYNDICEDGLFLKDLNSKVRLFLSQNESKYKPEDVANIITDGLFRSRQETDEMTMKLGKIITGEFGTDRMDYILRDLFFAGVPLAQIDPLSLIRSFVYYKIIKDDKIVDDGIAYLKDALPALESLLASRYHLILKLHKNIENRIATKMFKVAVQAMINDIFSSKDNNDISAFKETIESWYVKSDEEFILMLEKNKASCKIITDILKGQLWKKILIIFSHEFWPPTKYMLRLIKQFPTYFQELESNLEKSLQEHFDGININGNQRYFVDITFVKPPKLSEKIIDLESKKIGNLYQYSPLLRGIRDASLEHVSILIMSSSQENVEISEKKRKTITFLVEKEINKTGFKLILESLGEERKKIKDLFENEFLGIFTLAVFYLIFLAILDFYEEENLEKNTPNIIPYLPKLSKYDLFLRYGFSWNNLENIRKYLENLGKTIFNEKKEDFKILKSRFEEVMAELRIMGLIRKIKDKPIYTRGKLWAWEEKYELNIAGFNFIEHLRQKLLDKNKNMSEILQKIYEHVVKDITNIVDVKHREDIQKSKKALNNIFNQHIEEFIKNVDIDEEFMASVIHLEKELNYFESYEQEIKLNIEVYRKKTGLAKDD